MARAIGPVAFFLAEADGPGVQHTRPAVCLGAMLNMGGRVESDPAPGAPAGCGRCASPMACVAARQD